MSDVIWEKRSDWKECDACGGSELPTATCLVKHGPKQGKEIRYCWSCYRMSVGERLAESRHGGSHEDLTLAQAVHVICGAASGRIPQSLM